MRSLKKQQISVGQDIRDVTDLFDNFRRERSEIVVDRSLGITLPTRYLFPIP